MAKHRLVSGDDPLTREEAADTPAYWSVDDSRWPTLRPDLPSDVADLLAPPIVVGVARVAPTSRLTPPGVATPVRRTLPTPAPVGATTVPVPSPATAGPIGAAAPSGRHRRPAEHTS
ncbi:hypothetical protein ACFOOK_07910 [Micromonospora krabiensis]|uniref:Uncharacterized protein n=1 Tax=Micromonospora krabiensis TaxID=307121 RepID=A0A1C3NC01_9ACTN|nr:hypothetical protein [Micromonospora krabiensis]SBV30078.1 hypothetical protein GA0070620_5666 [Micromonospora krabiensis]